MGYIKWVLYCFIKWVLYCLANAINNVSLLSPFLKGYKDLIY